MGGRWVGLVGVCACVHFVGMGVVHVCIATSYSISTTIGTTLWGGEAQRRGAHARVLCTPRCFFGGARKGRGDANPP